MKVIHIGENIRDARVERNMSQSDLARALDIEPQAVQKWEAQKSAPRTERIGAIASALSTSVQKLVRGTTFEKIAESNSKNGVSSGRVSPLSRSRTRTTHETRGLVPLISWEQAATWGHNVGKMKAEEVMDWMECPFERGPNAFILEVAGESNYDPTGAKSYAPGEFITVDPAREPVNRSMVVIQINGERRAALRQLLMDESDTRMLKALNPSWPERVISFPPGSKIIGVVIGKWVPE